MSLSGAALREFLGTVIIALVATFAIHVLFFFSPQDLRVAGDLNNCYDVKADLRRSPEPGVAPQIDGWAEIRLLFTSYGGWLTCLASGSLGTSLYSGDSVGKMVAGALPATLGLLVLGIAASSLLSLALGWRLATSRGGGWRLLSGGLSTLSLVPVYLLAFTVRGAFLRSMEDVSGPERILSGALEIAVLAVLLAVANGIYAESVETVANVIRRETGEPYVRSLISRRISVIRHVLRGTSPVLIGLSASQIPRLVTAVFILEFAFNKRGLGWEALRAFREARSDVPVVLGITLAAVLVVRLLLGIQRVSIAWLNPRLGSAT